MKYQYFTPVSVVMALCALLIGKAYAHSALVGSVPANEQVVATAPELMLHYNEPVRLLRLTMTDANDKAVNLAFTPETAAKEHYMLNLPELAAGTYTVNWTLIGGDGHTMSDKMSFSVDPAATASAAGHMHSHSSEATHSHTHGDGEPHSHAPAAAAGGHDH